MGITRTVTTRVHCDVCGEWVTGWESEGTLTDLRHRNEV